MNNPYAPKQFKKHALLGTYWDDAKYIVEFRGFMQ